MVDNSEKAGKYKICYMTRITALISSLFAHRNWERQLFKTRRPSLLAAIIATFGKEYGFLMLLSASNDIIAQLGQPMLLGQFLLYFR